MEKVERTITVGASPKAVFDYLSDSRNLIRLLPGAVAAEIVHHDLHGGLVFHWTRKLCQVRFEGTGECTEHTPFHVIAYKLSGGLNNDLRWSLNPLPAGTEVVMHLSYDEPLPLKHKHTLNAITEA